MNRLLTRSVDLNPNAKKVGEEIERREEREKKGVVLRNLGTTVVATVRILSFLQRHRAVFLNEPFPGQKTRVVEALS